MSKHTPAPWTLPHFAEPDTNCMCGYVLTGDMFGAVCTVHASGEGDDWQSHGDSPKFAEAVANAHLISAAPDMIDALEEARVQVSILQERLGIKDTGAGTLSVIDAALVKAKGGAA